MAGGYDGADSDWSSGEGRRVLSLGAALDRPSLGGASAGHGGHESVEECAAAALVDPDPNVEVSLRGAVDSACDGDIESAGGPVHRADREGFDLRRCRSRPGRYGECGCGGDGGEEYEEWVAHGRMVTPLT